MPATPIAPPASAAALVIGNELLSGKVEEANVHVLARTLRGLGVELRRVVMILDDIDEIAREVKSLSDTHDWVFTSGGVGPTHDDVTVLGVAKAFGVAAVEDPLLAKQLRDHYQERCTPGHLQMALVPAGATLETNAEILKMKLPVIVGTIKGGTSFLSRAVYTKMDEGDLKPLLDAIVAQFPDVGVGSYPKWSDPTYRTKLTFDGRDATRVDQAKDAFVALLPDGEPQRVE